MKKNKISKYFYILIPFVLLLIIGVSFAYWRINITQTDMSNIDTLNCLSSTLTNITSAIDLQNEYPITNEEGMKKNPYTFKITNECDTFIYADISIEVLDVSTLSPQYVRASLNESGYVIDNSQILSNYDTTTPTIAGANSYILNKDSLIGPNDSSSFDLRIWLDEATTSSQGANRNFKAKIIVTVSPTAMPVHLTVKLPVNPNGIYNSGDNYTFDQGSSSLKVKSVTSKNEQINLTNKEVTGVLLTDYIMSLTAENGVYNEPANDYRYQGKNPNNYIIFNGELWQIIGVFSDNSHGKANQKLIKIIKADSLDALAWNKELESNNWRTSSLYKLLNEYYYNGIDETGNYCYQHHNIIKGVCNFSKTGINNDYYRNMIENVTWHLGSAQTSATAQNFYEIERGSTVYEGNDTQTSGFIGLIYPSDYGYSVLESSCPRTIALGQYQTNACGGSSWLRGKGLEWTITPQLTNNSNVWRIYYYGNINTTPAYSGYGIRPTLYLKTNVLKLGGTGTDTDPYIVGMNS